MQKLYTLILLALLTSCATRSGHEELKQVFRYNESKGITSLDPAFARNLPTIWPVNQLFNGLVQLSDSLTVEPAIARSWEVSPDGLAYTFYLRNDVYFHNSPVFPQGVGRRVTANDFIYSFSRIIDPAVASPGAWVFNVLNTAKEGTNSGCVAVNDTTLIIHITKPFPPFLGILSMPYAFVVPHEAIEAHGKEFRSNPVGTGPFMFRYWRDGERLILRRNPNYFETDSLGKRLPYLEAISISFIADKQSEFLEFLMGNLDFISGIHASSRDELLTRSGQLRPRYQERIRMLTGPYLNTEYLGFMVNPALPSTTSSPVLNEKFRRAIAHGIDREKMMTYLRSNMGYPAHAGFVPPGMPGFGSGVEGFSYNPQLARQLLAEAGYPNGKGLETLTLCTTSDYVDISEFIQHQLGELGIPIAVEVFPGAAYREMMSNSRMLFFRGSWVADYADAENYLSLFHSQNHSPRGPNYTHFSSIEFDKLYAKAMAITDPYKRQAVYRQMDSLVISRAPVIPLYYDKVVRFVQPDVRGLGTNPMNLLVVKRVYKD